MLPSSVSGNSNIFGKACPVDYFLIIGECGIRSIRSKDQKHLRLSVFIGGFVLGCRCRGSRSWLSRRWLWSEIEMSCLRPFRAWDFLEYQFRGFVPLHPRLHAFAPSALNWSIWDAVASQRSSVLPVRPRLWRVWPYWSAFFEKW